MKKCILLMAAVLCAAAGAAELVIAEKGKSDYQIVVPDPGTNKTLDKYVALGGEVIQTALKKAAGVDVPLVTESKKLPGKPAIYVGNVKALARAGLSSQDFELWEHAIALKGKDIFCYGKDLGNPFKKGDLFPALRYPDYFIHYAPGSLKSACTFTEKFLNTRFVIPKHNAYGQHDGIRTRPQKRVAVPEKFSWRRKARFRQMCDMGGILYSLANDFYFGYGEGYSVHYHISAIPQDKYFPIHPEYFALLNGKRFYHEDTPIYPARPQYCLSNPEVQDLIYKNALLRADLGYKVVEFGQTDGFIGCQCEPCKKMYNTSDWGEKIWRLHADMAARLEKDRPGVIPAIACYGPTHKVPQTFKKFATKKMIIDVAPATKKLIAEWKKFNVTGMAAWTYYFGSYKASSYAPSADFAFLKNELKWLRTTPVTYLYNCGIRVAPALNGPWVYAYGKFGQDPDLDAGELLRDYCLFVYGDKAAPAMEKFFKLLDDRSRLVPVNGEVDFNDFGKKRQMADEVWYKRYTPAVLAELKKHFAEAEKVWIESDHTKRLRLEFAYLCLTADVNNASQDLREANSRANRLRLADAIDKREAYLKTLIVKRGGVQNAFSFPRMSNLRAGGSMGGLFGGAFNSDPQTLRQDKRSLELVKVRDFADPAWAKIPAQKLIPLTKTFPAADATFKAAYDGKALLLICEAPLAKAPATPAPPRDSTALWRDAVWEIFVANGINRCQLVFSAAPGSAFDSSINANNKANVKWRGNWSHKDTVKDNRWRSEVTIPLQGTIGKIPAQGEPLQMQVAFSTPGAAALYAWNLPLSGAFSDITGFGNIRFGARPAGERIIDINGDFSKRKVWLASPPKVKVEYIEVNGKPAVKFGYEKLPWGALRCGVTTALGDDEEAVFSVTIRGKGKGSLGVGWQNMAGRFVVNGHGGVKFDLSDKPQTVTNVIRLSPMEMQKGAAIFYPNIFITAPGGEAIVEKAELKIRLKR